MLALFRSGPYIPKQRRYEPSLSITTPSATRWEIRHEVGRAVTRRSPESWQLQFFENHISPGVGTAGRRGPANGSGIVLVSSPSWDHNESCTRSGDSAS